MKVMCIAKKSFSVVRGTPDLFIKYPEFGCIYTVVDTFEWNHKTYFILKELGEESGWMERAFAPLSDIDETELIKEREESYA